MRNIYRKALTSATIGKQDGASKFSVRYTKDNKPLVVVEKDILEGVHKSKWVKTVKETFKTKFPNGIDMKYFKINVNTKSSNEFLYSRYTQSLSNKSKNVFKDKLRMADNLDKIV